MRFQLLILTLSTGFVAPASLPEITSYAKVTKNGEEAVKNHSGPLSWLMRTFANLNTTKGPEVIEGRSGSDISITVSPVYVPPKIPELHKGEAVDYPTTKRYSTLDEEMIAQLDAKTAGRSRPAQDRFHPPASFQHDVAHANAARLQQMAGGSSNGGGSGSSQSSSAPTGSGSDSFSTGPGYSSPVFPGSYDYKPPSFIDAKPSAVMPSSVDTFSAPDSFPKSPSSYDSFGPSPGSYGPPADYPDHESHDHEHDHDHDPEITKELHSSSYGSVPIYGGSIPPKPVEYAGHFDHPSFVDDPYIHDDHDYHHDIIYDHLPDDHTTPPPEMMDQRLSKRPYSYYYIGKKLWYIPLYFSIYFIIYIAALILKSIARHKINFPSTLAAAAAGSSRSVKSNEAPGWLDMTVKVLEGIETARKAFVKN